MRAREVHGIEAVGLAIISNWSVRSSFLRSKHLGALKVWNASANQEGAQLSSNSKLDSRLDTQMF